MIENQPRNFDAIVELVMKRGVHFFALLYAPLFSQDLEKSEIFRDNENIGK